MTWFYLSFADGRLPKGEQWLGASIVEGSSVSAAIQQARRLGINPGGEVLPIKIEHLPPPYFRNRLIISDSELREMGDATTGDSRLGNETGELVKPSGVEDDP